MKPLTAKQIHSFLTEHNISVKPKASSRLMRLIGFLLALTCINKKFMTTHWTIIHKTLYFPSNVAEFDVDKDSHLEAFHVLFAHEFVHVRQREKWGILWQVSYLLFPLPFLLAWFRWRWEREAYLVNIIHGRDIDDVVTRLWNYGWPWPKTRMRAWFVEALAKHNNP